jgi:hypothetical protein
MLPVSERQKVEGGEKGGSETQMIDANPGLAFGNMPSSIGKDAYGLKSSPESGPDATETSLFFASLRCAATAGPDYLAANRWAR